MSTKSIKHYGIKRRSGRYPWGSGNNSEQRGKSFRGYVNELKKSGLSETEIAEGMGISIKKLRNRISSEKMVERESDAALALKLRDKGYSLQAIGQRMGGINESSVRSLLDPSLRERNKILLNIADQLADNVSRKGLIDVGSGVEINLGVNRTKLDAAISLLEDEGYTLHNISIKQVGGKYTQMKVLAPPEVTTNEVLKRQSEIKSVTDYTDDGGVTFSQLEPIKSVNSDRIFVRYKEDGGGDKDGVIELRRGVEELSLNGKRYAQVRIGVDDTHFMKGMALISDDIPSGYDIVYNTNKKKGSTKDEVFKPGKYDPEDPNNPFGSVVRQRYYIDKNGNKVLSPINIVGLSEGSYEEGSWGDWSKTLSSQVLSKQMPVLAAKQLKLAYDIKKEEFDEIMSLTNPAVKAALLKPFSDEADAAAVHLKAAALPGQSSHIILPLTSIKDNEVYAPNFKNGESVVLIRHPHGGPFEIPELTVNNRNPQGRDLLGDARDAVGIHPKVAERLSGADFDGDTVLVIPNSNKYIKTKPPLKALKDFDPKEAYKKLDDPNFVPMDKRLKGIEMGKVSNLITDMTIRGANDDEIARAVKHSMVVIDAEKHKLDYKRSYSENGIGELKKKYQGGVNAGASTLISRASAEIRIPERKAGIETIDPITGKKRRLYIDPSTGEKLYSPTNRTFLKREAIKDPKTGRKVYYEIDPSTGEKKYFDTKGTITKRLTVISRMEKETDAHKLSSGTPIEKIYADHANALKDLANRARIESIKIKHPPVNSSARKTFEKEVSDLDAKLREAYRNKPKERQAQLLANQLLRAKFRANPDLDADQKKKLKGQALIVARSRVGAKKDPIQITDREWFAIQAGAISHNKLLKILQNTDLVKLKERATPRENTVMSPARTRRAKSLLESGLKRAEVAKILGVSISSIDKLIADSG